LEEELMINPSGLEAIISLKRNSKKPKSYLARHPGDFCGAEKVETGCKAGLNDTIRLVLAD
jgi:hypothetical protein